jgi:imidazolonepropionase-like amidohydrolase
MILHATYMDEDALTAVVDRKVPLVPTFTFQANLADYGSAIGADPQLQAVFKEEITASADQLKQAHQAGVPILTGSESGFSLTPYGDWHYRELNLLQTYLGLTPLEAIRAGTEFGAIALRKEGELGALKAGYLADLLILADDPLKDLDQLGRRNFIDTVIKAGRVVDRSLPLPSTWQIPGWRMSAFSDDILTRSLAESHLGPL